MMMKICAVLLLVLFAGVSGAADTQTFPYAESGSGPALTDYSPRRTSERDLYADMVLSKSGIDYVSLTPKEQAIIDQVNQWAGDAPTAYAPIHRPDGAVQYLFGVSQASVICAIAQVTDIELETGEQVNSVNIGDAARWKIEPAISNSNGEEVQHLIVKPMDVGLETSLIIATSRRTYHLKLKSTLDSYMPRVTFSYPEDALQKFDLLRQKEKRIQADKEEKTLPTGEYLGDLDFDYAIKGKGPFKPVRVFNDGRKTIIEMPKKMHQQEAPVLLRVRKQGRLFKKAEQEIINYRVQSNRYIVDSVPYQMILVSGVGGNQDRITITWNKAAQGSNDDDE